MHRNLILKVSKQLCWQTSLIRLSSSQNTAPKKTCLFDFHVEQGGKMVDFAGWHMPVQYKNLGIQV